MTRPTPRQRDFRRLKVLAKKIAEQADHFERNTAAGKDDTIRGLLANVYTDEMGKIGRRLYRRWIKAQPKPTAEDVAMLDKWRREHQ